MTLLQQAIDEEIAMTKKLYENLYGKKEKNNV